MNCSARALNGSARALLAVALLVAACGEPPPAAPVEPRALWLLEATPIRVGDVAGLDRLVVTPPGWKVAPLEPMTPPEGFWLLDAEAVATERLPARWLHRTRLRIRAREVGRFTWPATAVTSEAPDGEKRQLALPALELEVVSVLPEAADRLTPHGVRPLPEAPTRSLLAAAAAGALGSLAALAVGLLVVRRRRARAQATRAEADGEPPELRAAAGFARARLALPAAPAEAAHVISAALRRFVRERYDVPAPARTSEELAALPAPLALATRWAGLVALLRALDAERFAATANTASHRERVEHGLAQAEAFVAESQPPAAPR